MSQHFAARLSLALYFALLALISVNLMWLLEAAAAWALLPLLAAGGVTFAVWRRFATRRALLSCLLALGAAFLLAVALVLAAPAWQVIADGASRSWAGRMAPMFAAALALHACNLWLATVVSGERDENIERLARLLYGPGLFTTLVTALILSASLVLGMELLARSAPDWQAITRRFLERGVIPPLTVLLFFWGALLLAGKAWNGWYLRRVLARFQVMQNASDASTPLPSHAPFLQSLAALLRAPRELEENLQLLWRRHEESYLMPRYLGWAVPILGFIGTVLGISLAAEGIRRIIASDAGLSSLSSDLDGAIAPLGIAFDTTLIALSLSVVLTLLLALVQRAEERLLATLERRLRDATR